MGGDPLRPALMGGRSALTCVVSPYGGPVTTGKPGKLLAPSRFGFSQSPLPALCRQATSCAWRTRLRKIPNRRSGCSRGHAKGRSGEHSRATLAAQTVTSRNRSGILGGLGGPYGQKALQEAQRNRTTTRAIRYVQCGLVDMCARSNVNRSVF